mmetsp:Transcript_16220/g.26445  ORF Transcript_16220/g.26445 Transcript_16220/m.26445 type:complete len:324 (-) Transcript_16220:660-1631(-)
MDNARSFQSLLATTASLYPLQTIVSTVRVSRSQKGSTHTMACSLVVSSFFFDFVPFDRLRESADEAELLDRFRVGPDVLELLDDDFERGCGVGSDFPPGVLLLVLMLLDSSSALSVFSGSSVSGGGGGGASSFEFPLVCSVEPSSADTAVFAGSVSPTLPSGLSPSSLVVPTGGKSSSFLLSLLVSIGASVTTAPPWASSVGLTTPSAPFPSSPDPGTEGGGAAFSLDPSDALILLGSSPDDGLFDPSIAVLFAASRSALSACLFSPSSSKERSGRLPIAESIELVGANAAGGGGATTSPFASCSGTTPLIISPPSVAADPLL